jgi:hypothetical protein
MRFVDSLAAGIVRAMGSRAEPAGGRTLARLARSIAELEHMRMFIGVIVEADEDRNVRAILVRGTERLEAALADALGGERAKERARVVLATMWGLGLYHFAMRPPSKTDPTRPYLAWLSQALRRIHDS